MVNLSLSSLLSPLSLNISWSVKQDSRISPPELWSVIFLTYIRYVRTNMPRSLFYLSVNIVCSKRYDVASTDQISHSHISYTSSTKHILSAPRLVMSENPWLWPCPWLWFCLSLSLCPCPSLWLRHLSTPNSATVQTNTIQSNRNWRF